MILSSESPSNVHDVWQTRANNQVLALATVGDGTLQVQSNIPGGGSVHVVVDVNGYFQ